MRWVRWLVALCLLGLLGWAGRVALRRLLGVKRKPSELATLHYEVSNNNNNNNVSDLFVVVNGLLGSSSSGQHVARLAAAQDTSVAAARVQCSDVALGVNLYSEGVHCAADRLLSYVRSALSRHPSLTRLHVLGNSYGGLVARAALPQLRLLCRVHSVVLMCSPHCGATKQSLFRRLVAPLILRKSFAELTHADDTLAALASPHYTDALKAVPNVVLVASVHDLTVPASDALFGLAVPKEAHAAASNPPPVASQIVWEGKHEPSPAQKQSPSLSTNDVREAIKQSLQQVPARLVVATGEHENETRPWNSEPLLKHLIDLCLTSARQPNNE